MKHNLIAPRRSFPAMRRAFSALSIVLSLFLVIAAFGVTLGTSWTYQGQLRRSGAAYSGTCNFQFSLWDAVSAGTQQGSTQSINSVSVVNGLFTVTLDFNDQFKGDSRWLATNVQCSGDGGFTPLDPRQPLTAAPYALSLRPGANITGTGEVGNNNTLRLHNPALGGYGLWTSAFGATSIGVLGDGGGGAVGVFGSSNGSGSAIHGQNTGGGYAGRFIGPVDVQGDFTATSGGTAISGTGLTAVSGISSSASGIGVRGEAVLANSAGVFGLNRDSAAIWGKSTGNGSGVFGENTGAGFAGRFIGPVSVQGTLTKSAGTFQIDHPLDPANKFLSHSFVESPDMKNIYDGNVTTDASGRVTVTLPDYFTALNRDYRYQLTVLGGFAQAVISREIAGNSFEIHTDKPGVRVSWQVTGIRQDAYAKEHPIVVEEFKPTEEKGLYLYPAGFGAGEEKGIGYPSRPATAPGAQDPAAAGQSDPENK